MSAMRRDFLLAAIVASGAAITMSNKLAAADRNADHDWLRNARILGDRFVAWQSPYGGTDLKKCPYRSENIGTVIQGIGPQVRALYLLYDKTGVVEYKQAADRYAVFLLNTLHDPPVPYKNTVRINSKDVTAVSAAWMFGKGWSPCYELFVQHNPGELAFQAKAHAMHRWLQRHRRDDSYFGVGYPIGKYEDAQFSCDLGEVGRGLVGFYKTSKNEAALQDALGLAKYFLTEHEENSAKGVWSSTVGTWLVGPWPGGGAEHFTVQQYDKSGWGWSCLVDGDFLLELRPYVKDDAMRKSIDDKCVKAFRWCIDKCQFEDGAHGMFGRDDKWVGQTAAAILLYAKLVEMNLLPADIRLGYHPKITKSWQWLLSHTGPDSYPVDGYIKVNGSTTTKPPENLMWMMSWTVEALLAGGPLFEKTSD